MVSGLGVIGALYNSYVYAVHFVHLLYFVKKTEDDTCEIEFCDHDEGDLELSDKFEGGDEIEESKDNPIDGPFLPKIQVPQMDT